MEFRTSNRNRSRRAFTLVEMMVVMAIFCLLLAAVLSIYLFSVTSFASMANYSDMNRKGRFANDLLTRDIRSCLSIASGTGSQLSLTDDQGTTTYTYDPNKGTLTRLKNGQTQLLLSGVETFQFSYYVRPPTNSPGKFEAYTATNSANAKLVSFEWSCSRFVRPIQTESESIESGTVDIRNQ